jgi:hypothetical protein
LRHRYNRLKKILKSFKILPLKIYGHKILTSLKRSIRANSLSKVKMVTKVNQQLIPSKSIGLKHLRNQMKRKPRCLFRIIERLLTIQPLP